MGEIYICACSVLDNNLKLHETVSSIKFYSGQRVRMCRRHVHTAEKLDKIGARLETCPRLSQQMGLSALSSQNATKVTHLHAM